MAVLLGALLLASCSSAPNTQTPASSAPVADTAMGEAAKKFDAALENAGFTDASVVYDYDDAKGCAEYARNSKQRCRKWKTDAKLVGYDSFYNVGGDCEVELETDLDGSAWKVDGVNGTDVVLEGSPTKDAVVAFIKKRNDGNASPAGDLCNIA